MDKSYQIYGFKSALNADSLVWYLSFTVFYSDKSLWMTKFKNNQFTKWYLNWNGHCRLYYIDSGKYYGYTNFMLCEIRTFRIIKRIFVNNPVEAVGGWLIFFPDITLPNYDFKWNIDLPSFMRNEPTKGAYPDSSLHMKWYSKPNNDDIT